MVEGPFDVSALNAEVAKRLLRSMLRDERERAGLTQVEAASKSRMSQSKIIRIETGVVPAAESDVLLLLLVYGTDDARKAQILGVASTASEPDVWARYRRDISPAYMTLLASEQSARVVMKYEPSVIPGVFQTEEYARALMAALGLDDDKIDRLWEIRVERQKLLDREDHPDFQVIIGEACVSRPIGGERVMKRQVERLKELASSPRIDIQFLPFSAGAHIGMGEPFSLVMFQNPLLADIVFLENAEKDTLLRDEETAVKNYFDRFTELRARADDPGDLRDIDKVMAFQFQRAKERGKRPSS